jgi:hypothetical protein
MTDDEALQISRQAAQDARKRVGVDDKEALDKEFESIAETDSRLADALLQAGMLILESKQDTKH